MKTERKKLVLRLLKGYLIRFFAYIGISVVVDTFIFHEVPTRDDVTGDLFIAFFLALVLLFIDRDVWKARIDKDDEFNPSEVKS